MKIKSILASMLAIVAISAMAQQQPPQSNSGGGGPQTQQGGQGGQNGGNGQQPHHMPPPEAFSACSGKSVGATCGFTGREGHEVSGTCETPHHASSSNAASTVCRPQHHEGERPQGGQGSQSGSAPQ